MQCAAPLGVDVVVAGWFVVLQLFHQVGLGPAKLFELFAKGRLLGGDAAAGVRLRLPMVKVNSALRPEDTLAEEPANGGQEMVLADGNVLRVLGVPALLLVVLWVGDARVVDGLLAAADAVLAEHPPIAQVAHKVGAQNVAALRLPVCRVGACAGARALAQPGDRRGGVEDRLGDEGFVGGTW
ncbi:hypothetical protein [Micromonospora sp. WMMD1082]|uniref:hypothetical protein n=1 Tax=Micromonospora sp. WMMD1082 TaxID=3016104 RepID=UPI002416CE26|nr:hypothetical protein [Micromonospora sp. WMMD1082]MDG4793607.1 hypothetical protein [Micromonospora sp. WMMD1082]